MAQGDRVRAQLGRLFHGESPIPIYNIAVDSQNRYVVDNSGCVNPQFCGGVKPGSCGIIDGHPCKAPKSSLKRYEKTHAMGADYVNLYPVYWENYKQIAWISSDHFEVIGSNPDLDRQG